jgi:hypothetical protein
MTRGLMQLVAYGSRAPDLWNCPYFCNPQITFTSIEGNVYPENAVIKAGNGTLLKKVKGSSFYITDRFINQLQFTGDE